MLHHEFDRLMAAETEELERLTTNRDRLQGEQDRLMQAHYADARAHRDDALGLLANCADIYRRCDDTNRRLCNQAFFTKVFIDEDNELRVEHNRPFEMLLDPQVNANALTWAADMNKARTSTDVSVGKGSSLVRGVEAMERCGNRRPRVERLVSAWNQGLRDDADSEDGADDPLIGASAEPKKRPRTRLTDSEVDAMRTARADGVSVGVLAKRFDVHRGTVWAKTRHLVVPAPR